MVYVWMCPTAHAGLQDVKLCFHRATEEPMENKCDEQVAAKALITVYAPEYMPEYMSLFRASKTWGYRNLDGS